MLAAFQQFVGINVIFYYGATLWQLAGFSESQSLLINIVSGAVSIAACFVTIAVIDKIGRKPLLLIGSAGMAVTLFAMVYAFSHGSLDPAGQSRPLEGPRHDRRGRRQPLRDLLQLQLGPGDVGDARRDVPEPDPRLGACRVAASSSGSRTSSISFSFPVMAAKLGLTISYTFYGVCAVISFFLVQRMVHETRGKELEQMEG